MKPLRMLALIGAATAAATPTAPGQPAAPKVMERSFVAGDGLTLTVRATKPQDLDCDLQIMGYFKHKASGDTVLSVIVDFDKMMGGPIKALRDRGEFMGEELETIVLTPPAGVMKPRKILLIGYGDESKFSLEVMRRVAVTATREAIRLGAKRAAFAPALFDQGYEKLHAREVAATFLQGVVPVYDTEKRLQKQGLAAPSALAEVILEAGPTHFDDVIAGVTWGLEAAKAELGRRDKSPYTSR
jgi:Cytosol aminopeptidase family, N-terminal domain